MNLKRRRRIVRLPHRPLRPLVGSVENPVKDNTRRESHVKQTQVFLLYIRVTVFRTHFEREERHARCKSRDSCGNFGQADFGPFDWSLPHLGGAPQPFLLHFILIALVRSTLVDPPARSHRSLLGQPTFVDRNRESL